jgi:uncharacterized tellurite resistance protein B-like protein
VTLPADIQAWLASSKLEEPNVVLRASCDLGGEVGETFVAADRCRLVLASRHLGADLRSLDFTLREIEDVSLVPDGLYANLEIAVSGQRRSLQFPAWDKPELRRVVELWQTASGRTSRRAGLDDLGLPSLPGAIGSAMAVSPRVALAASLQAMAEADGEPSPLERAEVERVLGGASGAKEGALWLRQHGVDGLLGCLGTALSPAQKRCLLANVLGVAMADGLLRTAEEALADRFKSALDLADAEFEEIHRVLLARHNLAVFAESAGAHSFPGEPAALTVFCAALLALIEVDGSMADEEQEARSRLIEDPAAWEAGGALLAAQGVEGVLVRAGLLGRDRQWGLLANLLAVGMCDGWLRGSEQDLIDRFRQAMGFSPAEYEAVYQVLRAGEDLSDF